MDGPRKHFGLPRQPSSSQSLSFLPIARTTVIFSCMARQDTVSRLGLDSIVAKLAITQSAGLYDQLQMGIRYFDIRLYRIEGSTDIR